MIISRRSFFAVAIVSGLTLSSATANPVLPAGVWTKIGASGGWSNDVQFDMNNRSVLYTCGGGGQLLKTTDGGTSWTSLGTGTLTTPQRVRIDPNDSRHLYVIQGVVAQGFYVTTDGGTTWTTPAGFDSVAAIINDRDMYYIDVDPTDFNHILLSYHYYWYGGMDAGVVESFDGGKHCIIHPIPGVSNGGFNVFFLYSPKLAIGDNRTWLYMTQGSVGAPANSQGFWRTTNAGATWSQVSSTWMTHGGSQIYYTGNGTLYAAWEEGVAHSTNNGATWQTTTTGLSSRYYFPVQGDGKYLYTYCGGTYRSLETDGINWTLFNNTAFATSGVDCFTYDSMNNIMYAAARETGVWAMKMAASSEIKRGLPATVNKNMSGNRLVLSSKITSGRTAVGFYDVKGQRMGSGTVATQPLISRKR